MIEQPKKPEPTDLERTEELYAFLQGTAPEGYIIQPANMPNLTAEQAWTVIWYLGNQHWQVKDFIERCDVCGDLHDTEEEGTCLDYGEEPYHFCDDCMHTEAYIEKAQTAKENPDG